MTPSRARGRKVSKRMWAVLECDGALQMTSADPLYVLSLMPARWACYPRTSKGQTVIPVTVTWTLPTKPKPRKAK